MKYPSILFIVIASLCFSCNKKAAKGAFVLQGQLKNISDQKVYLDQIFFDGKDPQVLDTADIRSGKFEVSAIAAEEGLYRLRFEKQDAGYLFINDAPEIKFAADVQDKTLNSAQINTHANVLLKSFLLSVDRQQGALDQFAMTADSLVAAKASDSMIGIAVERVNNADVSFQKFIVKSVDTLSDPMAAIMALGYSRRIDPAEFKTIVPALANRFPGHRGIEDIIIRYNAEVAKKDAPPPPEPAPVRKSLIGTIAPDIQMADSSGKIFSLSSLRGKYVLVDFWASWCVPCRGENPNVVANFNKFKNKNFTVLGVSLDEDRKAWLSAVKKDGLVWKQVSDLKGWSNAAVELYGFEAIPYNVLLDPQGRIIATELREQKLGEKLAEVLK